MLPIISRCKFLGCHDSKRNIASHSSVAHLHFQIFEGRALIPIVVAHCLDRHCNSDFTRPSHLLANLKKFYYSFHIIPHWVYFDNVGFRLANLLTVALLLPSQPNINGFHAYVYILKKILVVILDESEFSS